MDAFFNSLTSGLILGSLYATMAIGLTIVYGVSHVFNFAHGHVAVIGAYITWFLMIQLGASLGLGIAASVAFMVVLGWLVYQLPIRHLLRRKEWGFATLLFTLGLAIMIEYSLLQLFGPRVKSVPTFFKGSVRLWFGRVSWQDIALVVISVAIIVLISLFLKRTTIGQAMRAVAQSVSGARIVGIDIDRVYGFTFAFAFVPACVGAAPGPGDYQEAYEELIRGGAEEIISIHMTSKGSGAYQAATVARDLVAQELPDLKVLVVDSRQVAMAHGWSVILAAREISLISPASFTTRKFSTNPSMGRQAVTEPCFNFDN